MSAGGGKGGIPGGCESTKRLCLIGSHNKLVSKSSPWSQGGTNTIREGENVRRTYSPPYKKETTNHTPPVGCPRAGCCIVPFEACYARGRVMAGIQWACGIPWAFCTSSGAWYAVHHGGVGGTPSQRASQDKAVTEHAYYTRGYGMIE